MRILLFALIVALVAGVPLSARAGISDDLKFCSSLKSSKERLACYDAAARIEVASAGAEVHAPVPSAPPVSLPIVEATPPKKRSSFEGTYVGVTSGYDFGLTRATSEPYGPNVPLDSLSGPKTGLVAGHNAVSGPLLLGLEARVQYNLAESSASRFFEYSNYTLPKTVSWMWCGSCDDNFLNNYPFPANNPITLSYKANATAQIRRPLMADISARTGMIFGDWLIYSRLGAGFEQTQVVDVRDESTSSICNNPIYARSRPGPQQVQIDLTGCGSITGGPIIRRETITYAPIVTLGFGFERNFGAIFIRGEAEMINHFHSGTLYYTPAANIAAGYRF